MKKLLLILVLTASTAHAQWKPDRADYEVLNDGNFYTTAHDMQTALSIAQNEIRIPNTNHKNKNCRKNFGEPHHL
jgi:hypothetical protein